MTNAAHLNKYLSTQSFLVGILETIIQRMKPGERKPMTKLCKEVAPTLGLKASQLAPFWNAYVQSHPEVTMVAGRYGGMVKQVKPGEVSCAEPRPEPKKREPKATQAAVVQAVVENPGYIPSDNSGGGLMIRAHFYAECAPTASVSEEE
jgi:hypothetical protein